MEPNLLFKRQNIISLDGEWGFLLDKDKIGDKKQYFKGFNNQYIINVPFSYTTKASGVNVLEQVDIIWYQKEIEINSNQLKQDIYLCCEGIDEKAIVYVNGKQVGRNEGGNIAFRVLLNYALKVGKNLIVIKCEDDFSLSKARGKQRWLNYNYGCWYTQTNGIYKSIYLDFVPHVSLKEVKLTPVVKNNTLNIDYVIDNFCEDLYLDVKITFEGNLVNHVITYLDQDSNQITLDVYSKKIPNQVFFWHPFDPKLYDLEFKLIKNNKVIDNVKSYFGFREFTVSGNKLLMNGFSFYSKLVLYQGYFKDSNLTPENDNQIIDDIKTIKELGFNGIRAHNYVPSEKFLSYCDKLGLLVWIEYPSPHMFSLKMRDTATKEWLEIMKQKYNHPCVVAWVIFNESWGIRGIKDNKDQQDFVKGLYYMSKSYDSIRPIISNDGWEHVESDILTLHHYEQNADKLIGFYKNGENHLPSRNDYVDGYHYNNNPIIISEFGGTALEKDITGDNWGYGEATKNNKEFYLRFKSLIDGIYSLKNVCGFCYTQYNDVQQEKNGLLDENRNLKVDKDVIRNILLQKEVNISKE